MSRTTLFMLFATLLALLTGRPVLAQEPPSGALDFADYMLPLEDYHLNNGLRVILARDDSAPVVAVNLTYHVGGANDPEGRSGFAHLFEHMMFYGSAHVKQGEFDKYLTEIGAENNAYTADDKTVYYATAPATELPRILWLESDRMASLVVNQEAFDTERQVVIEEYNQRVANAAYGVASRRFDVLPFLGYAPYERPTIGNIDDLNAATLDDVQQFHELYYVPNNATLVIVGDIDIDQTKLLVDAYFGKISSGDPVTPILARYPLPAAFPTVHSDENGCQIGYEEVIIDPRAELPALWASVVTTDTTTADAYALGLLGRILGEGDSSRFERNLVQSGLAAFTFANFNENRLGAGVMQFGLYPKPGDDFAAAYPLLRDQLTDVIENGVSAEELARAKQQMVLSAITDFRGHVADTAEWLQDAALRFGDPALLPAEMARYADVSQADIQRVARTYLCDRPLNLVSVLKEGESVTATPPGQLVEAPPLPPDPRAELPPGVFNRYGLPASLPASEIRVPEFVTSTLPNGLQLIVVEQHKTPEINLALYVGGSNPALPETKQGVADLMTSMLTKGTKTRSAEEIATAIESVGGSLSATALSEFTRVSANGPSTEATLIFDLLADVTLNPTFPEAEFVLQRDQLLAGMRFDTSNPNTLASRQFNRIVYPGHPYSFYRTPTTVNGITTQDLADFHRDFYHPNNALLVVVGDLTPEQARSEALRALGEWTSGQVPNYLNYPRVRRAAEPMIYLVDRPDSEQSTVRVGNLALRASDPGRYAFDVANTVLGGSGLASRLSKNLREAKGYTYGVSSGFTRRNAPGAFLVASDVGVGVTGDAVGEILRELRLLRSTGVLTDELSQAKGMLIGGFTMSIADPDSLAQELAFRALYGIPLDEIQEYAERINEITATQVISAARINIDVRAPVIVVVGNAHQIRPQLQKIAPVSLVDVDGVLLEVAPKITDTVAGANAAVNACVAACRQPPDETQNLFETDNAPPEATATPPTPDAASEPEPDATPTPEG
jgi:zinc protease